MSSPIVVPASGMDWYSLPHHSSGRDSAVEKPKLGRRKVIATKECFQKAEMSRWPMLRA